MNLTQLEPTLFVDVQRIVLIRLRQGNFDPETKRREAIADIVLDNGRAEAIHLPAGEIGEGRLNKLMSASNQAVHDTSPGEKDLREQIQKIWDTKKASPPQAESIILDEKN